MDGWLGVVIMVVLGVGFAAVMIGLSVLLGPRNPTPEKLAPYECGIPAVRHRSRVSLSMGGRAARPRLGRVGADRHVLFDFARRVRLRVAQGRARLGVTAPRH